MAAAMHAQKYLRPLDLTYDGPSLEGIGCGSWCMRSSCVGISWCAIPRVTVDPGHGYIL